MCSLYNKNIKKAIDIPHIVQYNMYTEKGGVQ
nr:MAG TPA: hypothetical protein [Caudoviricetes sp.]